MIPETSSRVLGRGFLRSLSLLLIVCFFSGCFLAPFLDAASQVGVTAGDRERLLSVALKEFGSSMSWGDLNSALKRTNSETRRSYIEEAKNAGKARRIIEFRTEAVTFGDGAWDAEAQVTMRYYEQGFYIVKEQSETQVWDFSLGSGWRMTERKVSSDG